METSLGRTDQFFLWYSKRLTDFGSNLLDPFADCGNLSEVKVCREEDCDVHHWQAGWILDRNIRILVGKFDLEHWKNFRPLESVSPSGKWCTFWMWSRFENTWSGLRVQVNRDQGSRMALQWSGAASFTTGKKFPTLSQRKRT